MPIFNQQTNLSGQGNFAPGVTYYAGIKAPSAPAVHLPRANASFNLDLSRIGDAMIQASRDKRETDIAIAKIDASNKEKAAAAAEKQLKLDMSNAYAQEIADVAAQVDQGRTDPIAASRMIKTINDKYFSYGVLEASTMATIRGQYDGGISEYQEKTREQLRQSNISREENTVTDLLKYVPSAANLPRAEQLMLAYNLQNTDLQLDDAVRVATANPTDDNMTVLQNRVGSFADAQAGTFMSNYLYSNNTISAPNMKRNFIQALDEPLRNRGVNSQMRAYALHKQLERYGPLMTEMGKWSEDTLKYYKNTRQLGDEMFKLAVRAADPVAYYEHEENNVKYKLAPDERISTSIDPVTGFQRQSIEIGNYTLPKTVARSLGDGTINEATEQVPVDAIEYLQAKKASPTMMSILYSQGHVPVGPFGRARSDLTVAGTYNDQVVVPGRTLYNPATTGEQISNAYNNNANYMRTTKDNPLAISNMTEQDNYDGTNNVQQLNQRDRRFAYNTLGNPQRKAEADVIYNDNVLPFSESGEFAAFRNSVVMDPVSGNLTMLNTYEKGGVLTPVAQLLTASRAKTALRNINDWTGRVTQNPEQRAQLARSFFDGEMNIPDYAVGMGGASLQTSKSEKTAEIGLKTFDTVSEWFNKLAVDTSKKYFEGVEKATTNYLNKDIEPEYQEALKVDPTLTRSQFLYNKVADYLSENLEKSLTYLKDKMDQYDSKFGDTVSNVRNRLSQRRNKQSEAGLSETEIGDIGSESNVGLQYIAGPSKIVEIDGIDYILPRDISEKDIDKPSNNNNIIELPKVEQSATNPVIKSKSDLENIIEAIDEVPEAALEAISDLGFAVDNRAFMTGLIPEDKGLWNEWKKKYNSLGEKSYAPVRQGLYAGFSLLPAAVGLGIRSTYEFLKWLKDVPGIHLETDEEEALRTAAENIDNNLRKYNKRYNTWRRFFTGGLFTGEAEPLEYE